MLQFADSEKHLLSLNLTNSPVNVALINATSPEFTTYFSALGIETLAAYAREHLDQHKYEIKLFDSQLFPSRDLMIEKIVSLKPDIIGLSINAGGSSEADIIINELQNKTDFSLLILGNTIPTFKADRWLNKYPHSMIVTGEGEEAFIELLRATHSPVNLNTISNLVYKTEDNNIITTEKKRIPLKNFPPPAYDNIEKYVRRDFRIGIETSRGCSYNCTFCNRKSFLSNNKYCEFPAKRTLENMMSLSKKNVPGVNFVDDDSLQGSEENLLAIANGIIENKKLKKIHPDFHFFFSTRVTEVIKRQDIVAKLAEAGLVGVFLGIEAFDEEILKRFHKQISNDQIKTALGILERLNLTVAIGIIMFDPLLTLDQLERNVSHIKNNQLAKYLSYPFNQLRLVAGSPMVKQLKSLNLIEGEADDEWLVYAYKFQNKEISEIVAICKEWEKSSYRVAEGLKNLYRYHNVSNEKNSKHAALTAKHLGTLRETYIDFLNKIITLTKNQDYSKIKETEKNYSSIRASLITKLLQNIDNNEVHDTFNELYKYGLYTLAHHYALEFNTTDLTPKIIATHYHLNPIKIETNLKENAFLKNLAQDVFRKQDLVGANTN